MSKIQTTEVRGKAKD